MLVVVIVILLLTIDFGFIYLLALTRSHSLDLCYSLTSAKIYSIHIDWHINIHWIVHHIQPNKTTYFLYLCFYHLSANVTDTREKEESETFESEQQVNIRKWIQKSFTWHSCLLLDFSLQCLTIEYICLHVCVCVCICVLLNNFFSLTLFPVCCSCEMLFCVLLHFIFCSSSFHFFCLILNRECGRHCRDYKKRVFLVLHYFALVVTYRCVIEDTEALTFHFAIHMNANLAIFIHRLTPYWRCQ